MKARWIGIYDRGNIAMERVHFQSSGAIDLTRYIILDDIYVGPMSIGTGNKGCFWFSPKVIGAGEHVVVYTRAGTNSSETRPDGTIYHFFFRGLSSPLYARPEACAVLYELADWTTTPTRRAT